MVFDSILILHAYEQFQNIFELIHANGTVRYNLVLICSTLSNGLLFSSIMQANATELSIKTLFSFFGIKTTQFHISCVHSRLFIHNEHGKKPSEFNHDLHKIEADRTCVNLCNSLLYFI